MIAADDLIKELGQLENPVLRHLLWLLQAPQLVENPKVFRPGACSWGRALGQIRDWDESPDLLPKRLADEPPRRLGLYVEELYHTMLEELLGWKVLARNMIVHHAGKTLGEMDFLLFNPEAEAVEHHEIAIKFYLGYREEDAVRWYGPNPADRLDLKSRRMLEQQSRLSTRPEAQAVLKEMGLPKPERSRIFMPGYFFYPSTLELDPPCQADPGHEKGRWLFIDEIPRKELNSWVPLHKPHWLGPWIQNSAPDASLAEETIRAAAGYNQPRLLAQLAWNDACRLWVEEERYFIVPRSWPDRLGSRSG